MTSHITLPQPQLKSGEKLCRELGKGRRKLDSLLHRSPRLTHCINYCMVITIMLFPRLSYSQIVESVYLYICIHCLRTHERRFIPGRQEPGRILIRLQMLQLGGALLRVCFSKISKLIIC